MLSPKSSSDIDSQSDSDSLNIHKKLLDFYRHENKTLHTKISKIDAKITEMHTYEQYDWIFKSLNDKQKRAEYKAKVSQYFSVIALL